MNTSLATSFAISRDVLAPEQLKRHLVDPAAGACACFEGWVRNHNDGEAVSALEYEAHEAIATKEGERILTEAIDRFDLIAIHCRHRIGSLTIGDCAVWVGVSTAHRDDAFDACRYVIDEVKHRVPIWKKEHYTDGTSGWVNCATGQRTSNEPSSANRPQT